MSSPNAFIRDEEVNCHSMLARSTIVPRSYSLHNRLLCSVCAGKLQRAALIRNRSIFSSARQLQIAVSKDERINSRFFAANIFKREQQDVTRNLSDADVADIKVARNEFQPDSDQASTITSIEGGVTSRQEPPHRRRKRLKATSSNDASTEAPLPLDASSTLSQVAAAAPVKSLKRTISTYLALSKPRLAFLIVLTTTASYSIYPVPALLSTSVTAAPSLSTLTWLYLTSGTFLTIASANTLNMLFEPSYDAKMSRTRNRPLVRGLISKRAALLFAILTGAFGTSILWYGVNPTTSILGAGNLALYAFAYTPLKRIHPINTWVGAIVGAVPPLMGWCAAASQYSTSAVSPTTWTGIWTESKELLFTDQAIGGWLIASLLFAWQFPHFFALSHAARHEYAGAGYKMLTSSNIPMASRVSLRYSLAMFPICAGMSYYGVTDPAFFATSGVINAWMLREAVRFWRYQGERGSARALFWASVWQLPIVLVLAMVQKQGLFRRLWRSIYGDEDLVDVWEDDEG